MLVNVIFSKLIKIKVNINWSRNYKIQPIFSSLYQYLIAFLLHSIKSTIILICHFIHSFQTITFEQN
jgi:hypothetical protein